MTEVQESTILIIFFSELLFIEQSFRHPAKISALISDETFSHSSKVKIYSRKLECGDKFLH